MRAKGCLERLDQGCALRSGPELLMIALKQLPTRFELPRELREQFVLFVGPRERGVGARLAVVVTQILVSSEEPDTVAPDGSTQVRGEITISDAFVPADRFASARYRDHKGLTGEPWRL